MVTRIIICDIIALLIFAGCVYGGIALCNKAASKSAAYRLLARAIASVLLALIGFGVGLYVSAMLGVLIYMDYRQGIGPYTPALVYGLGAFGLVAPWAALLLRPDQKGS
jgi:hypothetical protein